MLYIIVRRGDFDTYDALHRAFGQRAAVVWDRRRKTQQPVSGGASPSGGENRRQTTPTSWSGLGFLVVDRAV